MIRIAASATIERPIEEVCTTCNMNPNQVHAIKWRVTRKLREAMADLSGDEA